ncbi:MAG: glucose-6-phosphate isomerase [Gammaproteobacteria bacterium]|jgi:glucose-6-phosphate isomerase
MVDTQFSIGQMTKSRTELESWKALLFHKPMINNLKLSRLFAQNSQRFEDYSIVLEDLLFDFSKNLATDRTIELLVNLANDCQLPDAIEALLSGEDVNSTENRPALHTALRDFSGKPVLANGVDVMPGIRIELAKMKCLVEKLHLGHLVGATGKPITDVVNLGVGGSDLGSVMATEALYEYKQGGIQLHFVSSIDGTHLTDVLHAVDAETTLFIISSKSFTTLDTMANAKVAKQWLCDHLDAGSHIADHLIGVSMNDAAMASFGISADNRFYIWDWVGGRYSLASAVGLPVAIAIGFDNFEQMLQGMHSMDRHFRETPLERNIPVIMALLGVWYLNFFDAGGHVILPYDSRMHRFPAYLQQLEMESNGKSVNHQGEAVDYRTGSGVWGEVGPNAQHSFYQLLHQGTRFVLADFLVPVNRQNEYPDHHGLALANCLAQSRALMVGQSAEQVMQDLQDRGKSGDEIDRILPHKIHSGNKPNNLLLFKRLDPHTLGMLIAMYEHKVYVQSVIWDINAFDQWGVELGKELASQLEPVINSNAPASNLDGSTSGLLDYINRWKRRR